MNETDPTADGRSRRKAAAGGERRMRGRHRRRGIAIGLMLGVQVGGHLALDLQDVGQTPVLQAVTEVGDLASASG